MLFIKKRLIYFLPHLDKVPVRIYDIAGKFTRFLGRIWITLSICTLLTGSMVHEEPVSDLERRSLKGKVKSVLETRMNGKITGGKAESGTITYKKLSKFTPEGFEYETVIYTNNGKSSQIEYQFNTDGFPAGLNEYKDDGTLWLSVTYKLDDEGNKLEANFNWPGKGGYDEIREKSEQLYEVLNRNPWSRIIYSNDFRGFPVEEKYLRDDSTVLFKFAYRYNIQGKRKEMTYFNSRGRTSWETKYKYDRSNQLVKSIVYKSNRVAATSTYTYNYDENGNWIRREEKRDVNYNILTSNLVEGSFYIERVIEYY
jgi:hypothetical protein